MLLVLVLVGVISYSYAASIPPLGQITPCIAPCTDYGVVITTRGNFTRLSLSVYKFDRKKNKALEPSDVSKLETVPNHEPVDFELVFKGKRTIPSVISPLIKAAAQVVPEDKQASSPLLFSLDEQAKSIDEEGWFKVLGKISVFFDNKTTTPFLTGPYSVDGNLEIDDAVYRWHTMNFVQGNFLGKRKTVAMLSFNGIMDSEIAYEQIVTDKTTSYLSTIAGNPHNVVSSTFFRKGGLFPLYKYFEVISKPIMPDIESPCGPKGLTKKFIGVEGIKRIMGTGDVDKCRDIIVKTLFNLCNRENGCAYLKHRVKGEIFAMPNVKATMSKLGYEECTKDFTPAMLDGAIRRVCGSAVPVKRVGTGKLRVKTNRKHKLHDKIDAGAIIAPKPNATSTPETTGFTDCVNGNFLYLMLSKAYYLSPNRMIHVNPGILAPSLVLDPSLGELLIKMQLL